MRFSFVTCTYNRDKYLGQSLASLCLQDFDKDRYEVLVVDNNSTDTTQEVCQLYIDDYTDVQLRYTVEREQGFAFALNRGIKEARGEFLIYVDDDETIDKDYLQKLDNYLNTYLDAQLAATPVEPVYETEKPKWLSHFTMRLITGYFNQGDKVKLLSTKNYPGTGHTIIKKSLYDEYGYFNTDLGRKGSSLMGAEDKDMLLRLIENGVDCYYFPDIPIYHHIPQAKLTEDFFHRLTYSIGKSERLRTKSISSHKYYRRLFDEAIKWAASIVLCMGYTFALSPQKGWKLIQFRWNVTRGLLSSWI